MTAQTQIKTLSNEALIARINPLGEAFSKNAVLNDSGDRFAADNFALLKQARILSAHIPAELGGGGLGYREIAEIMDCPQSTVKTRMFYARKQLADLLKGAGVDSIAA